MATQSAAKSQVKVPAPRGSTATHTNAALSSPARMIEQEARALLARLALIKPFAVQMTMVTAAAIPTKAQTAIESHLRLARHKLRKMVGDFLSWLRSSAGQSASPPEMQRRFTLVRLRFNSLTSQLDIFADVLSQRSEHETGVWVAGLDDVAADALKLPDKYYEAPPIICYVDRGHGAAIRKARTRLPGGDENPVAVIRVPRERLVGSGIASSLVHEVGHQAAALLDLVSSLRPVLQKRMAGAPEQKLAWQLWERWISEIVADLWSVAKVGIAAPMGLVGVVSLPRAFVFRVDVEDPHPIPWVRVKLSCAMGNALYPHPQWQRLTRLWESLYPTKGLDDKPRRLLALLEATIPDFVNLLANHRPRSLRGRSLKEVLASPNRSPARLSANFQAWRASPAQMRAAPPTLAFAAIGQARADGHLSPEEESRVLSQLLTHWALRSALETSAYCASTPRGANHAATSNFEETSLSLGGIYD